MGLLTLRSLQRYKLRLFGRIWKNTVIKVGCKFLKTQNASLEKIALSGKAEFLVHDMSEHIKNIMTGVRLFLKETTIPVKNVELIVERASM